MMVISQPKRSDHVKGKKMRVVYPLIIILVCIIAGCSNSTNDASIVESAVTTIDYETEDAYIDWSEADATFITFNDEQVTVDDEDSGVILDDNRVEIHTSGTYVLEGQASDNQIVVNAEDQGTIRIILNGVSLTSTTTAPIFVEQADKTVISVEDGTENTVIDATEYVYEDDMDEPKAAIYSKDDLTINGTGKLTVQGNFNDGITGNDDLKIIESTIDITAVDDGLVGRDLFAMKDATITIDAGGDGVKSSNDEDADKAHVVLESGTLTIDAESDGITSENTVTVLDGEYNIVTAGGSPETIEATQEVGRGFGDRGQGNMQGKMPESGERPNFEQGEMPELEEDQVSSNGKKMTPPNQNGDTSQPSDQQNNNEQTQEATNDTQEQSPEQQQEGTESTDTPSTKGIKAVNSVIIAGGTISIDSNDDALHSDKTLTITAGDITIATGDDAVHADETLAVTDGTIKVSKSYEGIESNSITISGGSIHVIATDDGLNINGGTDEMGMFNANQTQTSDQTEETNTETEEDGKLLIEGGYIYINADGDGLDSNTSVEMTSGTVIVYGPTNSGNGALDYNSSFNITGGTLIAAGSSGMAQGISEDSTQNSIMMTFSETEEANTTIYVTDSSDNVVTAVAPEKQYQTVVISSADLKQDETYTIYTGGELSGEVTDGYTEDTSVENGSKIVEFTLNSTMMYLNESGETDQTSGMVGPRSGQGQRPASGLKQESPQLQEEESTE